MSKHCILPIALCFCLAFTACNRGEQSLAVQELEGSLSNTGLIAEQEPSSGKPQEVEALTPVSASGMAGDPGITTVMKSYYAAQEAPVFDLFKNTIEDIMEEQGWIDDITASLQESFGKKNIESKIKNPVLQYDTFAQYYILDHDWGPVYRHEEIDLYHCAFTADNHISGFVIVSYDGETMEVVRLRQTDYLYDLRANYDGIAAALAKTDIDLSTAQASRVGLQDTKNNRGDAIIRFVDGKGDNYVCYFGDAIEVEKFTR